MSKNPKKPANNRPPPPMPSKYDSRGRDVTAANESPWRPMAQRGAPISEEERQRAIAKFLKRGGKITKCPSGHADPQTMAIKPPSLLG